MSDSTAKASFAGGCFWCMQPPYDKTEGVLQTTVGFTGGHKASPTYEEVTTGRTGHAEAIEVVYDPSKVTYDELLDIFWRNVDPTTVDKQFADVGSHYRTAIFYHDDEQKALAEASKKKLEDSGKYDKYPIVTEIVAATVFYAAEEYHQKYYEKNSRHYQMYKIGSGRAEYIEKMWPEE